MVFLILIVIISLVGLLVLHEFGHFIIAKKLGVKVEEFGIGYPPRLFGKRVGETIYSINLLPFGAFVKIQGEEEKVAGSRSFSERPILERAAIVLGGVVSFWLVAFLLFSFMAGVWGLTTAVSDDFQGEVYVQIIQVAKDSPAEIAGIRPGDTFADIDKLKEIKEFIDSHKGEEISLVLKRGEEILNFKVTPRTSSLEGQGPVGIALARLTRIKSPWYKVPLTGAEMTAEKTVLFGVMIQRFLKGDKIKGVELVGPIGIVDLMIQALQGGAEDFLMFLAMIAIWLALFNLLPIPALDGGKLLFLLIEAVRRKPVPQIIEQKITAGFFLVLILIMVLVTIKDITRLF